ncbi:helix-turn-helix transcriptional regulator [Streptomyces sp. DSM 42041]|uniref:Helix-turn-helix transcriptional regulator n=1 Tax=Streptomyces hazeniae TaxID=3075538 RepID=A0ABU2NKH7_9ACTN|nr:helix-turn-helix transcriptional regulator [Streptomyces sp. DSM 42041]MDT0377428.1 helix-turn-helix transcriptional regulator [Streptomyces sp. DSM 42041]
MEDGTEHPPGGAAWDEDDTAAVVRTVGKLVKLCRERSGMTQAELGAAIGYSLEQVSSVERGRRVPKPEFLSKADEVLHADGLLTALQKDVAEARYPKKVRDLAKLEADAVELGAYSNHNMHGLLQTEEYARALYGMRWPAFSEEQIDQHVSARMARQEVIRRSQPPTLTFIQEEVTLRRPIGGSMVLRRQLEHLLEVGRLRHVSIQLMPTGREEHAGMAGEIRLIRLSDGTTLGHSEAQLSSRVISTPKDVHILEMRYGFLRAQALSPRESVSAIEKILGET